MKKYWLSVFTLTILLMQMNCASTKFPKNEDGVFVATPNNMNKDAIRLKGKVLSKKEATADRNAYIFQIIEVVDFGNTFASVEPKTSEEVILYTTEKVRLKKNAEVLLDAISPLNRGEGMLVLNMVN